MPKSRQLVQQCYNKEGTIFKYYAFFLVSISKSRKSIGDRSLGHCQIELMEADSHHVSAAGRGRERDDDFGDKPRDREHIVTVCDM